MGGSYLTSNTALNTDTIQRLTNRNPPMKELATSKTITIVTNVANFTFRDQTGNMSANAVTANCEIYCASSPLLLSPSKVFDFLCCWLITEMA